MAADGHFTGEPWFVAGITALGATVASFLVYLAQRLVGKGNLQLSYGQNFTALMTEMRLELVETREELKQTRAQRDEFKAMLVAERAERHAEREAWRAERHAEHEAWRAERTELSGKINNQDAALQSLERLLKSNGTLPDLPEDKTPPAPVKLVATTLRQDGAPE